MTDKELKKLGKGQLINIINEKSKEADELRLKIDELTRQINESSATIKDIGSIAEAALEVNGVFSAAQKAADQYLTAVMEMNNKASEQCRQMIESAQEKCRKMEDDAVYKCASMERDATNRCAEMVYDAQEKAKITMSSMVLALRDYYLANEEQLKALPADLQRIIRNPY